MAQARRAIEIWRVEYNTQRPHSSLGDLTPEEYAERGSARAEEGVSVLAADSNRERTNQGVRSGAGAFYKRTLKMQLEQV